MVSDTQQLKMLIESVLNVSEVLKLFSCDSGNCYAGVISMK